MFVASMSSMSLDPRACSAGGPYPTMYLRLATQAEVNLPVNAVPAEPAMTKVPCCRTLKMDDMSIGHTNTYVPSSTLVGKTTSCLSLLPNDIRCVTTLGLQTRDIINHI